MSRYVIPSAPVLPTPLPGIAHATLAGSAQGLHELSVWKQSIGPGGATPPHRHDCDEVVIVEAGTGELHIDGRIERFGPGNVIVVPRNVEHQIVNSGATALQTLAALAMAPVRVHLPDGAELALPWQS